MDDKNLHMADVTITACKFTNNDAYDGYGIYIEGSEAEIEFNIEKNAFTDNHDYTSKSIVISEIGSLITKTDIADKNQFNYKNEEVKIPPVLIVDNKALPPTPSPIETPTSGPKTPTPVPETPTSQPKTQTSVPTQNTQPVAPSPDSPTTDEDNGENDIFEVIKRQIRLYIY